MHDHHGSQRSWGDKQGNMEEEDHKLYQQSTWKGKAREDELYSDKNEWSGNMSYQRYPVHNMDSLIVRGIQQYPILKRFYFNCS